ncbi:MAG: GAF domain-containing protein [Chloroflexi bacterium]|nr:GAF domain-containing protein [Chloroflexota bacterium]MBU1752067.1 GAF domain-containing protein [Chloroflexota bacterium]MBU1878840.1 GAF domain-containing protein [Chloroflexota bacterium]
MGKPSVSGEARLSRDDAALLNLVGRHLAAADDLAELLDILDLLVEQLGASGALLVTLATTQHEPLRFLAGSNSQALEETLETLVARVRTNHQSVLAPTLRTQVAELDLPSTDQEVGSAIAIPIQGQPGTLIGALAFVHPRERGLNDSHLPLLTAVAYQMAAALRLARLSTNLQRHVYELSVLDEVGQAFSSLDLDQLLRLILERISRTLRINRSVLFMLDKEHEELVLESVDHPGASESVLGLRVPLAERPHIADAIRTRQAVQVRNIYADPRWRDFWQHAQRLELEAALAIPLIVKGQAIGAISLDRTSARPPFTAGEISLCQIIANQAASAIENARLYSETRRYAYETRLRAAELDQRAQRLALLNRLSTALVTSLEISNVALVIAAEIAQVLNVPGSALFILDPTCTSGQIVGFYPPHQSSESLLPIEIPITDRSYVDELLQTDAPLTIRDVTSFAMLAPVQDILQSRNMQSLLVVPITMTGRVLGVIALDATDCLEGFSPADLELAMTVGNQVAFALSNAQLYATTQQRAIENARLHQQAQRRADQLRLINDVSQEINAILDTDLLLWSVVRLIRETLDCYHVAVALIEDEELVFKADVGYLYEDSRLAGTRLPLGTGITGQVAQHGTPLAVPDVTQSPDYLCTPGLEETCSEVAVPLKLGERIIGVLDAQSTQAEGFDESDVALLQSLATQVTVALENARLFDTLRSERAKLEAIIDGAGDVVIVTDQSGRLLLMNCAAERAFAVTADALIGRPLLREIPNPDVQTLWREGAAATAFPLFREVRLDDGRTLHANLTTIPQVGLVAVMQDISHLKELDRAKSEFVSTVSHDLRSPLQAIRINLEMLPRMGSLTANQREAAQSSLRVLDRMTKLVQGLLDLGRIEAGVGITPSYCSLHDIMDAVVENMQPQVRLMGLTLSTRIPPDLPHIYADKQRLTQVVANLVDNAIKYTPSRGQISVMARVTPHDLVVEVEDNGPGIPAADLAHLFEKFYRVSGTPTQDIEGLGLGLAIVKSIVEAHQGRVWVASSTEPDTHGSTFGFTIPIRIGDEETEGD